MSSASVSSAETASIASSGSDTWSSRMEEELKCPSCRRLYVNPVMLPCSHNVCNSCVNSLIATGNTSHEESELAEMDKLSILSETDSGVSIGSRPSSYVGGVPLIGVSITCPACRRSSHVEDVASLPRNSVLETIVGKFGDAHGLGDPTCQLCEGVASHMCEQCSVFYCPTCLDSCHPTGRGARFAHHRVVNASDGKLLLRSRPRDLHCHEHGDEAISRYCDTCSVCVCTRCSQEGRHSQHDLGALNVSAKSQKTDLSKLLQSLSEQAKQGTEFIQQLKRLSERVTDNCLEFEALVVAQCDALVEAILARKRELLASIQLERGYKSKTLRQQLQHSTATLHKTTALIQFSIEVLKESDPAAFLQVSPQLTTRVSSAARSFHGLMEFEPRVSPDFELTLDNHAVLRAIHALNFFQKKQTQPPPVPEFIPRNCSAENNTVTLVWSAVPGNAADGYSLELDDGDCGDMREVYSGRETICTVEGLHFDSMYNARVKAFNNAGESAYSRPIRLQTADVAWFSFDSHASHHDMLFSNSKATATTSSYEDRVVFGSVGFSRGIHYWEFCLDRFENTPDPAFGVARFDTKKDQMLGKDERSWSMYIDSKRSWFVHAGAHSQRTEGGVTTGSTVGVLLDLHQGTLSFYVNERPHGPVAFVGLAGVFYPVASLNRNVQISLHTGLELPTVPAPRA